MGQELYGWFLVKKYFENKWSLKARDPKLMFCMSCLQFFETLGILGRGLRLFFLKIFISFTNFSVCPFFSDQWYSIYRQSFVDFEMSSGANIMH